MICFKHIIYLITLTLLGLNSYANNLDEQNSTICLSVGLYASIIDLDDITLTNYTGISGNRNTEYHGNDQFTVKSNGPVRIFVSGDAMTHKITNTVLPTNFKLENDLNYFDTQANQAHLGEHTVNVKAITTEISNSPAGQYEGTVVVTVTPQIEKYLSNYNCTLRQASYPINSSYATIAFEDLYPRPGDADYNDMVVNLRIDEYYNKENQLQAIDMEFIPIARGAGYDHKLKLDLDGSLLNSNNITTKTNAPFIGDADITVNYNNLISGQSHSQTYDKSDDITLFNSTKSTLTSFANVYDNQNWIYPKFTTSVHIELLSPELNIRGDRSSPDLTLYRPYLTVKNTGYNIDLFTQNTQDNMIDQNGYPFGIVVPYSWQWPLEKSNINQAYPYFAEYRSWLNNQIPEISEQAMNWYLYPDTNYVYEK